MFKDKQEVIDFIYQSYFEKQSALDPGLSDALTRRPDLVRKLLQNLGLTQGKLRNNILVTGSKGKGSVCRITAALLQDAGLKVGLFTSPHLNDYNERIRVNGEMIGDAELMACAEAVAPAARAIMSGLDDKTYLGPMGIAAAMAQLYFDRCGTDINIFECGRGARYDEVSAIDARWSVINRVFLEHVPHLGTTLEEIAWNKAGVLSEGQELALVAEQSPEVDRVITHMAEELGVPLVLGGREFNADHVLRTKMGLEIDIKTSDHRYTKVNLPVFGEYNALNAALAVSLAEAVLKALRPGEDRLWGFTSEGLSKSFAKLNWQGCTERVDFSPEILLDGCINSACAGYLRELIVDLQKDHVCCIIGVPDTKDFAGVIRELEPVADRLILTRVQDDYFAFKGVQQAIYCTKDQPKFSYADGLSEAFELALRPTFAEGTGLSAKKNDRMICVIGTQALLGEAKAWIRMHHDKRRHDEAGEVHA